MTVHAAPASAPSDKAALPVDPSPEALTRQDQSNKIIRRNAYWALGVGLIPAPLVDFVALTAVQMSMLKELSDVYEVKFFEEKAKTLIGSLVTGIGSLSLTALVAGSLAKLIPVVGQITGAVAMPLLGGAFTVATGRVFAAHFETGGTLLDFDGNKMRTHFRAEFEKAKETVKQMKQNSPAQDKPGAAH